jgi:hypothetical protein
MKYQRRTMRFRAILACLALLASAAVTSAVPATDTPLPAAAPTPAAQPSSPSSPSSPAPPAPAALQSPLARLRSGREAADNNQIITTGIRSPELPSNHALIITVSEYQRSPLPGVLTDRKLGIDLAASVYRPRTSWNSRSARSRARACVRRSRA